MSDDQAHADATQFELDRATAIDGVTCALCPRESQFDSPAYLCGTCWKLWFDGDEIVEQQVAGIRERKRATTELITWIPVAERLPDAYATVLVSGGTVREETARDVAVAYMTPSNKPNWMVIDGPIVEATHWAELPKGPTP